MAERRGNAGGKLIIGRWLGSAVLVVASYWIGLCVGERHGALAGIAAAMVIALIAGTFFVTKKGETK